MTAAHPAKFSPPVLEAADPWLDGLRVLDPFAGVGRVHLLSKPALTVGVELEPEWAAQHPRTICADATRLPFPDRSFEAVMVSPVYGNRMSDSHNAQERCKACAGSGVVAETIEYPVDEVAVWRVVGLARRLTPCERCEGKGRNAHKRHTYTHTLGRQLHHRSTAAMHWHEGRRGDPYRLMHEAAWAEAARVLRPGALFLLNVKDHERTLRKGQPKVRQFVAGWHVTTLCQLGFTLLQHDEIDTPGMRHGANTGDPFPEQLYVFRLAP